MADKSKRIVRLNVGGETFVTSSTTLLSAGETFFTSLLSGRHESDRDSTGAFFIDRSPKYFDPILHYLRTNTLEVSRELSTASLKAEAEFYGIQKIVDHLDHIEKEKAKNAQVKKVLPILKDFGCYVNADNDHAFLFGGDDKVTCISGYEAFTQAMVVQSYPRLPTEWKNDQSQARSFAIFYDSHVSKGTYKMNQEGKGMIVTLPSTLKGQGNVVRQHLATLSIDSTKLCVTSYSCSAGSGLFMCKHENPHHFHLYKFQKF